MRNVGVRTTRYKTILGRCLTATAARSNRFDIRPSGCGKNHLVASISRFSTHFQRRNLCSRKLFSKVGYSLAPENRHIGMMFQDLALFPHLTVEQNICFGLHKHYQKAEQQSRIQHST